MRRLRVACTAACASGVSTPITGTASSSCSCGRAAEVAVLQARTIRPPTPESKTPIGRGSIGKEATLAPVLRRALGVAVCALAFTATANAATPQQLTIPMSDGTQLSCSLTLPDGVAPTAGVILF